MSDEDLATLNAIAVTREYRVQPHIGKGPVMKMTGLY
jgi:hypothetical protein